jgi:hypothetical protein
MFDEATVDAIQEVLAELDERLEKLTPLPTADILIETLVAADGTGTLTIQCEQELKQIREGVVRGTDKWEVISGTGQFEGAEGSGTGTTKVDLNTGTFTKNLKGEIILPNGD